MGWGRWAHGEEAVKEEEEETRAWGHVYFIWMFIRRLAKRCYIRAQAYAHRERARAGIIRMHTHCTKCMHTYTYIYTLIWTQTFAKPVNQKMNRTKARLYLLANTQGSPTNPKVLIFTVILDDLQLPFSLFLSLTFMLSTNHLSPSDAKGGSTTFEITFLGDHS